MKIHIEQSNPKTAGFKQNLKAIEDCLSQKGNENDLIIFPAMALSGSNQEDFFQTNATQQELQQNLQSCCSFSTNAAFVVGSEYGIDVDGKHFSRSLFFIADNKILATVAKEYPYSSNIGFQTIEYREKTIAFGFAEDFEIFVNQNNTRIDYCICLASHYLENTDLELFENQFKQTAKKLNAPVIWLNRVGGEGFFLFTGGSFILNHKAEKILQLPYFEESSASFEMAKTVDFRQSIDRKAEILAILYKALVMGIKDYAGKNGFKKAILGLSGGMDSALVAVLAVEALGHENVKAFLLPSQFSTDHSIEDALSLTKNLGIETETLTISNLYDDFNEKLQPVFKGLPFDLTEENIQARIRGLLLMAVSNKTNALLLNTSNKSEIAVGYGTLYGDMCGSLAVLGDMLKTQTYVLAKWINRLSEIIPDNIITKAPSAELRHNQKDSDSLPDYDVLDKILELYLEKRLSKEDICKTGIDSNIVERTLSLVNRSEYKRRQAAPILKVSGYTFGLDIQFPIA